jgi:hypothetical protein
MMDSDDGLFGEIEFNLAPEQSKIVSRAIELAATSNDAFGANNPLLSIMQWWQTHAPKVETDVKSLDVTLTEACRLFIQAHEKAR